MNRATDRRTGDIVDAEDLWLLAVVDHEGYECLGCGVPMLPCAYEPGKKVRPYFRAHKQQHQPDCKAEGEIRLLAGGKARDTEAARDTVPGLMPGRLVLRDIRPAVDPGIEATGAEGTPKWSRTLPSDAQAHAQRVHTRTAGTIRSICRAFLDHPSYRDQALDVPGVGGATYGAVFWKLKGDGIVRYQRPRIFYAPLAWARPQPTEDHLEVTLSAGAWSADDPSSPRKKLTRPYKVRVHWSDWNTRSRDAVLREINLVRTDHIQSGKDGGAGKGWFFFLGQQDASDEAFFTVHDHRLLCCLFGEMKYPVS